MKNPVTTVFLATGNAHKAGEFAGLATEEGLPLRIESARALGGMPRVVEDSGTFEGNARLKARALAALAAGRGWVMADDSGLCVDALDGAPGVESAHYAGPQADGAANLRKLIDVMRDVPDGRRGAHYTCVLVLIAPDGAERVFATTCAGRLLCEPAGTGGFGYDPLFVPDGWDRTFAELPAEVKNTLSHRGRAWAALVAWWRSRAG